MEAERSRLLNRHHQEKTAAQKDLKKKKGELLQAAQAKFDELLKRHEQELEEFDSKHKPEKKQEQSTSTTTKKEEEKKPNPSQQQQQQQQTNSYRLVSKPAQLQQTQGGEIIASDLREMSKKELEELCGLKGLGKKGSKEELITRLLMIATTTNKNDESDDDESDGDEVSSVPVKTTQISAAAAAAPASTSSMKQKKPRGAIAVAAAKKQREKEKEKEEENDAGEDDSEDEDEDEESEDEKEEEEKIVMTEEEKAEAERQGKRETFLQQALQKLLKANPDGIDLSELATKLIEQGTLRDPKNLAPERFGYSSMEQLLRRQPEQLLYFDSKHLKIYPPKTKK